MLAEPGPVPVGPHGGRGATAVRAEPATSAAVPLVHERRAAPGQAAQAEPVALTIHDEPGQRPRRRRLDLSQDVVQRARAVRARRGEPPDGRGLGAGRRAQEGADRHRLQEGGHGVGAVAGAVRREDRTQAPRPSAQPPGEHEALAHGERIRSAEPVLLQQCGVVLGVAVAPRHPDQAGRESGTGQGLSTHAHGTIAHPGPDGARGRPQPLRPPSPALPRPPGGRPPPQRRARETSRSAVVAATTPSA
ncbi:hypothetical protein GCM10022241_16840 [Micrococcus endophyticus]